MLHTVFGDKVKGSVLLSSRLPWRLECPTDGTDKLCIWWEDNIPRERYRRRPR